MNSSLENKCLQNENIKDYCNEKNCCNENGDCCNTEKNGCNEKVSETLYVSETLDPDLTSEPVYEPDFDLLQVDPLIDNSDCILNIEIPQFPVKINVNNVDVLPSLDQMLSSIVNVTDTEDCNAKNLSYDEMQNVMDDIEKTVNFTSVSESMHALNNPEVLFSRIQSAFDTFKEKTGRQMTYSEMRYMMG
jgi:hypothetical protein